MRCASSCPSSTPAQWKDEVPRLMRGALGRQRRGAWDTTVANAWGALAVEKFSRAYEGTPVAGDHHRDPRRSLAPPRLGAGAQGRRARFPVARAPRRGDGGAGGARASVGDPRGAGGDPAARPAVERVPHHQDADADRDARARGLRDVEPRRPRPRPARGRGAERHDLGRGGRPDPRGRVPPGDGPRAPVAHRHRRRAGRAAGSGRPTRRRASSPSARTTPMCPRAASPSSTPCA